MLYIFSSSLRLVSRTSRIHRPFSSFPSASYSSIAESAFLGFFDHLLQGCTTGRQCRQVHAQIIISGKYNSGFLAARIVSVYARMELLLDGQKVFNTIPRECFSSLILWNSILRANVYHGYYGDALRIYLEMRDFEVIPDGFSFPLIIRACGFLGCFSLCKIVHNHVLQFGFQNHLHVVNELIGMYNKIGRTRDARNLFDKMTVRNSISWNTMVSGFSNNYDCDGALQIFEKMELEGVEPNQVTWTSLISSYSRCGHYEEVIHLFSMMVMKGVRPSAEALAVLLSVHIDLGEFLNAKALHGCVVKGGFEEYLFVNNALICVYGEHGDLGDAQNLFMNIRNKNIVSWNALLASYAEAGFCDDVLLLFSQLEKSNGSITVRPNVISWSTVIRCCASHGRAEQSLQIFRQMQLTNTLPNSVTFSSVLSVCAELSALNLGREIHGNLTKALMADNILIQNGLVNMYTKCGFLKEGLTVFEKIYKKDLVSWNSMITGYGMHGQGESALMIFYNMIKSGLHPDKVSFVSILSACSHAGLVDKGRKLFNKMTTEFGTEPEMEHYACIIDLLSRAGFLQEATDILNNMPMKPNACVLGALLNYYSMHREMGIAEETAAQVFSLEPETTGSYMLLSNLYAGKGEWEDSARVRCLAKIKGLKKIPGNSWIEINKRVYMFQAGNSLQIGLERVHKILHELSFQMQNDVFPASDEIVSEKSFAEED